MRAITTQWNSWREYRDDESTTVSLPAGGDLASALFFPADYRVGMANLGYHYIFRGLRELGVDVQRFFTAPIPYRSVDRDTLFERFPLILASVSYEADVLVLAKWLASGGVASSRLLRNEGTLVGAGGSMTYINPLALSGVCDFILLGDGRPLLPHLVSTLRRGLSRQETLQALAEHPSFLVPSIHLSSNARKEARAVCRKEDITDSYGHGVWTTPRTVFGSTLLVELQRGCRMGCRYCTLPLCFGPFRQRPCAAVVEDVKRAAEVAPFDQVGLITPEASDYGDLNELLLNLDAMNKCVSFASLRVDRLTEQAIMASTKGGRHSITIAPETGGDGLRAKTGKVFTNDCVISRLKAARQLGVTKTKLYFMIGLPDETEEDVLRIADLCARIREETGMGLSATVAPFVPKPGTLWADAPFQGERMLRAKYALLAKACRSVSRGIKQGVSVREAALEYVLSWADSRLALEAAAGRSRNMAGALCRERTREELHALGLRS